MNDRIEEVDTNQKWLLETVKNLNEPFETIEEKVEINEIKESWSPSLEEDSFPLLYTGPARPFSTLHSSGSFPGWSAIGRVLLSGWG